VSACPCFLSFLSASLSFISPNFFSNHRRQQPHAERSLRQPRWLGARARRSDSADAPQPARRPQARAPRRLPSPRERHHVAPCARARPADSEAVPAPCEPLRRDRRLAASGSVVGQCGAACGPCGDCDALDAMCSRLRRGACEAGAGRQASGRGVHLPRDGGQEHLARLCSGERSRRRQGGPFHPPGVLRRAHALQPSTPRGGDGGLPAVSPLRRGGARRGLHSTST
jgi:hypothetical protein